LQINYGPDFAYPYIRHLTDKEVSKRKVLTDKFAKKLTHIARLAPKLSEKPKVLAVVDQ